MMRQSYRWPHLEWREDFLLVQHGIDELGVGGEVGDEDAVQHTPAARPPCPPPPLQPSAGAGICTDVHLTHYTTHVLREAHVQCQDLPMYAHAS